MARRTIATLQDLERLYPAVDLEGFKPTHHIELVTSRTPRNLLREDLVVLKGPEDSSSGVRYAYTPGSEQPAYAKIPPERWQCLELHGTVRAFPVRFVEHYTPPAERDGFVYFVQSSGPDHPIKIGWSQDVERRLSELQTANAHKLVLLGKVRGKMTRESALHERFRHLRMEAEWFRDAPEIHSFLLQESEE